MRIVSIFLVLVCLGACDDAQLGEMHDLAKGAQLYEQHCANCHQPDGTGLAQLMPPIKESILLKEAPISLVCMMKKGRPGGSVIGGKKYFLPMPANKLLKPDELVVLARFVVRKFGATDRVPSDSAFHDALQQCAP